jgi:protein TonB
MSKNRMVALVAVGLIHVLLGYALITGLASKALKVITEPLKTVNIKEEAPPPDEPPPPPPKDIDIPPFVPPPEVTIDSPAPPTITTQTVIRQPDPPKYVAPVAIAPPAPVAPPAPTGPTSGAVFNARSLEVSEDDYPSAALRQEQEGSVQVSLSVNTQGRVDACSVVKSSNFPMLDEKTCQIATRRFRAKPALQNGTPVASTAVKSIRWQINKK